MAEIPKSYVLKINTDKLRTTVDRLAGPVRRLSDATADVADALDKLQTELWLIRAETEKEDGEVFCPCCVSYLEPEDVVGDKCPDCCIKVERHRAGGDQA